MKKQLTSTVSVGPTGAAHTVIPTGSRLASAVVVGPTGAVGSALVRRLLDGGVRVFAVVRPDSSRLGNLPEHKNLSVVPCALDSLDKLPSLIDLRLDHEHNAGQDAELDHGQDSGLDHELAAGFDSELGSGHKGCSGENSNANTQAVAAFFHLGWENTFGAQARNNMAVQVRNIAYTLDAVTAAAKLGCSVFVGTGSQAEYGRKEGVISPETPTFPENGYGMAKLCAGHMSCVECEKYNIRQNWVRIFSVYGPCDGANTLVSSAIDALSCGKDFNATAGEQMWDYLYAGDAAKALELVALQGKPGQVYCLGSGRVKPMKEYLETIQQIVNPCGTIHFGAIPYAPKQVMHLQADISKLSEDTGFEPETDFISGIRQTLRWYEEKRKNEKN